MLLESNSLGPVFNILTIFSSAKFLKKYNIKGTRSPLLIFDQETYNDQTGSQARSQHVFSVMWGWVFLLG